MTTIKQFPLVIGLVFIFITQLSSQGAGDQVFNNEFIHEIRIETNNQNLIEEAFQSWNTEFYENEKTYFSVSIEFDGVTLDSIGFRIKGGISGFDAKKPLKLDFNYFVKGQELDGLKKLNLNNVSIDRSFVREALCMDIFRTAGIPASRTSFANVYLNGEYFGIYLLVEQVDKTFLNRHFSNNNGTLYKELHGNVVVKDSSGTIDQYNQLLDLLSDTNANIEQFEEILDTEHFIKYRSILNLINSKDNAEIFVNFYAYLEPKSEVLHFIPWDLNFCFFSNSIPTIDEVWVNSDFANLSSIYSCEHLKYNFTEERLFNLIDKYVELVRNYIDLDPTLSFGISDFENEIGIVKSFISSRIDGIMEDIDRLDVNCDYLQDVVGFQDIVINEVVASNDSLSGISDGFDGYPDWIELYNNTDQDISLDHYYLSDDETSKKRWKFPKNTIINSDEYLIVWADRDIDQGMHSNFKLSKDEGKLFLVHEGLTIIDQMEYLEQTTNISFARVPNGIGDFSFQESTFNQSNQTLTSIKNIDLGIQIIPNPISSTFIIKSDDSTFYSNGEIQDLNGICVMNLTGEKEIDVSHLRSGIFTLILRNEEQQIIIQKRLVINH